MHALLAAALISISSPAAATLTVGPGMMFPDIASALAVAGPFDLILVAPGTYGSFRVSIPVTIAASGGAFTVTQGTGPAIEVVQASGTVAISGAVIHFASLTSPAIRIADCAADVRLRDVQVDAAADLIGTAARAAIEIDRCGTAVLESVSVGGAMARRAVTTAREGINDGVSAVRLGDTRFLLQGCSLRGYDAGPAGASAGDAIRVAATTTGALSHGWLLGGTTGQILTGGNAAASGGSCLHLFGDRLEVELCGQHFLRPGAGAMRAGGYFAIRDDGGQVAPGVGRMVPACVLEHAAFTLAPAVIQRGSTPQLTVVDFAGGNVCLLAVGIGAHYQPALPGAAGRVLLDLASAGTVGFGLTPATMTLPVPNDPRLAGMQLTFQGAVVAPGGARLVTAMPAMAGVH